MRRGCDPIAVRCAIPTHRSDILLAVGFLHHLLVDGLLQRIAAVSYSMRVGDKRSQQQST